VEGAKRTAERVAAEGSTPVLLQADIVSWEPIKAMADAAFERLDGVDALVNNVGDVAREQMSWRDITEESIDHVLAVDVKGTMLCVHEFGARMLAAVAGARAALADAAVVSVQNGLGNEEVIAGLVPRVIRGSIVTAGAIVAPGVVRYDAPGDSWFGPFEPRPAPMAEVTRLARLLTEGGLRTHALEDARGPQWAKVIFNSATSPIAALTGLTVGRVCTDAGLRPQVDALVREAMAVCERAGISPVRPPGEAVQEAIAEAYDHKPSMLQDVLAHRATEIDVLNGGIAAEGRRVGVATPLHDCMVALVKGLEQSWSA
jgi:2-dehydropantoate 2-reductase